MILDILLSFILGLLLVYVLAVLYKPYQYQIIESNTNYPITQYLRID